MLRFLVLHLFLLSIVNASFDFSQVEKPRQFIKTTSGIDFGFSQNSVTQFHQEILDNCSGKECLDAGAGFGNFAAKLLSYGAERVDLVEKTDSIQEANKVINTYKNRGYLPENFKAKERYRLKKGDVIQYLARQNTPTYDCISALNLLHYMYPNQAKEFLQHARDKVKTDGLLYILANAPSGTEARVQCYYTAQENQSLFPGYMVGNRIDHQRYRAINNRPVQLLSHQTEYTDFFPLDPEQGVPPSKLWNGFYNDNSFNNNSEPVYQQVGTTQDTVKLDIKMHQSFFFWDKQTANSLLSETGWSIYDVYYLDAFNQRHDNYPSNGAKRYGVSLCIIAQPE